MGELVKAARLSDVPPGAAITVSLPGGPVALFNISGAIHAVQGDCPHRRGPLAEGEVIGTVVTCPWHVWRFDVASGDCLNRPEVKRRRYEVRVEGDDIYIGILSSGTGPGPGTGAGPGTI